VSAWWTQYDAGRQLFEGALLVEWHKLQVMESFGSKGMT
jgi:hypothetical protein